MRMSFLSVENQYRTTTTTAKAVATEEKRTAKATSGAEQVDTEKSNESSASFGAPKDAAKQDKVVISAEAKAAASQSKTKGLSADQLRSMHDQQMASFNNMLSQMLNSQANQALAAQGGFKLSADFISKLTVTPQQQAQAAQAISEDGAWGVNAVATRIMDMAVALSGGDTSKIELLQNAVEKGFKAAGVEWGTSLPSITSRTHDEINKRFDYWKNNGSLDGYAYQSSGV